MPAPTVITTPGDPTANSYASVAEFQAYWNAQFFGAVQQALSVDQIAVLLVASALVFDPSLVWTGAATLSTQALSWPRQSMTNRNGFPIDIMTIPQELKNAQCQQAGDMAVTDVNAANAALQQGLSSLKAGPVELHYFDHAPVTSYAAADVSIRVRGPEFQWINGPLTPAARDLLVASWYVREGAMRPLVFDVRR